MKTIVITGGPCSGKTSAIAVLRERLAADGIPAVFVEEAGTDLILNGISPITLGSMLPFQTRVAELQLVREAEAFAEAQAMGPDTLVICDRGICDGRAYLDEDEYIIAMAENGLAVEDIPKRYDAVFCLESTAKSERGLYTQANNSARLEGAEEAAALDDRTMAAWVDHPGFHFIANRETFDEKVAQLIEGIKALL